MSLSQEIRRARTAFHIQHEPVCDRCGHGASLHTLDDGSPCLACGERVSSGMTVRAVCRGFASEWFDNSGTGRLAPARQS